ncbi:MAG: polymerase, sigma-24 subunit, subfamily [Chloroflexi bacterium]|nr:polymerase, sigma-24 subunit, subfamily [Chloroflexota bacterium]
MLGLVQDAADALQDSLLGARRGLSGFEGGNSLRSWLYSISTNACLRLIARRPRRMLSADYGPPRRETDDLGEPVLGPIWLEPWPDDQPASQADDNDPAASYLQRESLELAFACYQGGADGVRFRFGAVNVVSLRAGRIVGLAGFLDPTVHRHFGLPNEMHRRPH